MKKGAWSMQDGRRTERTDQGANYVPTPEEIREKTREIRRNRVVPEPVRGRNEVSGIRKYSMVSVGRDGVSIIASKGE